MNESVSPVTSAITLYAPALNKRFEGIFAAPSTPYSIITELFNSSYIHGGAEDPFVPRRSDESFNPRLARIAQLLIDTSEERTLSVLGAALVAAARPGSWTTIPHIEMFQPLAQQSVQLLHDPSASAEEGALAIAHASMLDTVRHLHQSTRTPAEIKQTLELARKIDSREFAEPRYARFKVVLSHAISQQERRCAQS
jgi:hypothetical protein